MAGFCSTLIRIPDGSDVWEFAKRVARLIHDVPEGPGRNVADVQYAEGFSWLHAEGLTIPDEINMPEHPAFMSAGLETILLLCHTGSDSHAYSHCINGQRLRIISVCGRRVFENFGAEEAWEQAERDAIVKKYAEDGESVVWPGGFDIEMVVKAFKLPSPWYDLEELDICICSRNPDENDMSRAIS